MLRGYREKINATTRAISGQPPYLVQRTAHGVPPVTKRARCGVPVAAGDWPPAIWRLPRSDAGAAGRSRPAGVLGPAGGCQPQDRATNDHDEQPGSDHTRAFDPKTGRNFVYDKEKKAWTDTKTGESICPKGRPTTPTRTSLLKKPVVIGSNTDPNAYPDAAPPGPTAGTFTILDAGRPRVYVGTVSIGGVDAVFNPDSFFRSQETCTPSFFFPTRCCK